MNLKHKTILAIPIFITLLFSAGCSTSGRLAAPKEMADAAWEQGDFENALLNYEAVIEKYKSEMRTAECPVYGRAGLAALKTNEKSKALEYFEMDTYTPHVTAQTYYNMAILFREVDNLSREIMALSDYLEKFPEAEKTDHVRLRLFETYIISENWDLAMATWQQMPEDQKTDLKQLKNWFILNKALANDEVCDDIADELLSRDNENQIAMEWKAVRIFNGAEERYNSEMKAYENNRTNRQYLRLLDELEKSTKEFRKALSYFEKLYSRDPQSRYALYMSNIYVRFNDKERADFYRKKAGN